jgi:hypothetical protein
VSSSLFSSRLSHTHQLTTIVINHNRRLHHLQISTLTTNTHHHHTLIPRPFSLHHPLRNNQATNAASDTLVKYPNLRRSSVLFATCTAGVVTSSNKCLLPSDVTVQRNPSDPFRHHQHSNHLPISFQRRNSGVSLESLQILTEQEHPRRSLTRSLS